MENKIPLIYFLSILTLIILATVILNNNSSPNEELLGKWEEVSWHYEKAPQRTGKEISSDQLTEITKNLIIHEAEIWEFKPNGNAILYNKDSAEKLTWTLKGRGHILKLNHKNSSEYYQLYHVSEDKLVVHFHTELQAKGIVKMTFQKKI